MLTSILTVLLALNTPPKFSYEWAAAEADKCPTAVSWAENMGNDKWLPICQFDDGEQLTLGAAQDRVAGYVETGDQPSECEQSAILHWHISGGQDSAYEDAIADCTEGR